MPLGAVEEEEVRALIHRSSFCFIMAEISAPPLAHYAMQGVATTIVAPAPMAGVAAAAAAVPPQEEQASETLYIQNLNEKIKVDSAYYMARTRGRIADHACDDLSHIE